MLRNQDKYKKQCDKKKYIRHTYDFRKIVLIRTPPVPTIKSTTLQPKYKGSYKKNLPSRTYRAETLNYFDRDRKPNTDAHLSETKNALKLHDTEENQDKRPQRNKSRAVKFKDYV